MVFQRARGGRSGNRRLRGLRTCSENRLHPAPMLLYNVKSININISVSIGASRQLTALTRSGSYETVCLLTRQKRASNYFLGLKVVSKV